MLCRGKNKGFFTIIGVIGIISMGFGIIMQTQLPEEAESPSMAAGFITGIGAAFAAIYLIRKIQEKFFPDKVKRDEIDMNDERNIQLRRGAASFAWLAAIIYLAAAAFVLLMLEQRTGAYVALGGVYVSAIADLLAMQVLKKRM